jgi:hypothetical protein
LMGVCSGTRYAGTSVLKKKGGGGSI